MCLRGSASLLRPEPSGSPAAGLRGPGRVTRVLLISGICLYREGLADLLGTRGESRSSERQTVEDGIGRVSLDVAAAGRDRPRHARVDGVEQLPRSGKRSARYASLGLTVPHRESEVIAVTEAGISAFVTPDASIEQLVEAIEAVGARRGDFSPSMAAALMRRLAFLARDRPQDGAGGGPDAPGAGDPDASSTRGSRTSRSRSGSRSNCRRSRTTCTTSSASSVCIAGPRRRRGAQSLLARPSVLSPAGAWTDPGLSPS